MYPPPWPNCFGGTTLAPQKVRKTPAMCLYFYWHFGGVCGHFGVIMVRGDHLGVLEGPPCPSRKSGKPLLCACSFMDILGSLWRDHHGVLEGPPWTHRKPGKTLTFMDILGTFWGPYGGTTLAFWRDHLGPPESQGKPWNVMQLYTFLPLQWKENTNICREMYMISIMLE